MSILRSSCLLGLLAATAPAQAPDIVIPEDCLVIAAMDGPAKIAGDFAATRMGELLAGPRLAGLIGPMQMGIEMGIRKAEQQTGAEMRDLYDQHMEYTGRARFALKLLSEIDMTVDEPPDFAFVCVMEPDGNIDLEDMAASYVDIAENSGDNVVDVEVDGVAYAAVESPYFGVTLPKMFGDRLAIIGGSPLEDAIAAFVAGDGDGHEPPDETTSASMFVRIDGSIPMKFMNAATEAFGDEDDMDTEAVLALFEKIGLGGIGSIDLTVRASGEHVLVDTDLRFTSKDKGVFGWYEPERRGRPGVLDLIPRQSPSWGVSPCRFDRMYDLAARLLDEMGSERTMADVERQFEESAGARLREDVVDHLGNELLYIFDFSDVEALMVEDPAPDGVCYGISLRNSAAFSATLETLMRDGVDQMFETEEYRGYDVHTLNEMSPISAMVSIAWVISERALLVGVGDKGKAHMRGVLDEELARREGTAPSPFPEGVGSRLELGHQGWESAGTIGIVPFLRSVTEMASADGALPEVGQRMVQSMLSGIEQHQLGDVVYTGRTTDDQVSWRMIW